jgi:dipeptidyl aminopeptidase/acylaminoacyl peptidase
MTGMTTSGLKYLLAVVAVFWLLILSACVRQFAGYDAGLDAISPDDRWATIVEYSEGSPTSQLVRLDLQSGETITLTQNIDSVPESSFSPSNSDYVLFRAHEGWTLANIAAGQQTTITTSRDDHVQFLPDGKLLVIAPDDGLTRFIVVDPPEPESSSLTVDEIRYWFSSQLSYPAHVSGARISVCARPPAPATMQWVMVKPDYTASWLIAKPDEVSETPLRPEQSKGMIETLRQQEALVQKAIVAEQLTEEIEEQAAGAGKDLNDEELAYRVKEQLEILSDEEIKLRVEDLHENELSKLVSSTLFGILSPDGKKLLVLRQDYDFLYSLYLVDLEAGTKNIDLSSDTEWVPSFGFSSDGRHILFESSRDGGRSLYLANADGSDIRRVVEQGALSPCWH